MTDEQSQEQPPNIVAPDQVKFMAWHRARASMWFVNHLDFHPVSGPTTMILSKPDDPFSETLVATINEVDLLPFIGKRDQKGRDVYLGDLIKDGLIYDNICRKYGSLAAGLHAVHQGLEEKSS